MSRSQLLRFTAFMTACLLTLSGYSVDWIGARGTSSAPPDQAQDAAPEATKEPTGKPGDTSSMDPLEYGNCTSSDIQDYDDGLTDNDAEDTRAQAEVQVTKTIPAPEQVSVTANELSTDQVIKVSAGAQDVTTIAQSLVVVIEGKTESLTINGPDNTVWVGVSNKVMFGANGGDSQNYVFWHSRPPQAKVDPQSLNIIGRDVHASVVRSCRSLSRCLAGYRAGIGLPRSARQCNKPLTARRPRKADSSYSSELGTVDTTGGVDGSDPE